MRREEPLASLEDKQQSDVQLPTAQSVAMEQDAQTLPVSFFQEGEKVEHAAAHRAHVEKGDGGVARQLQNFTLEISDAARQFASTNYTQMIGLADEIFTRNITANLTIDVTVNLSTLANLDEKLSTFDQELQNQTGAFTDMMSTTATELSGTLRPRNLLRSVMCFLLAVLFSSVIVYRMGWTPRGTDPSVLFYCRQSRKEQLVCESVEPDAFLEVFNQPPMTVCLRMVGSRLEPHGIGRYMGRLAGSVQFDVSLDLKPFISHGEISEKETESVKQFINGANMLEVLTVEKSVRWKGMDEVRNNIRQRLLTLGFAGNVNIWFEGDEKIVICHNHRWSNFLRSSATQLLVGISVVGGVFLIPYVWIRGRHKVIESKFRIDVEPAQYWDLISAGVDAQRGFELK